MNPIPLFMQQMLQRLLLGQQLIHSWHAQVCRSRVGLYSRQPFCASAFAATHFGLWAGPVSIIITVQMSSQPYQTSSTNCLAGISFTFMLIFSSNYQNSKIRAMIFYCRIWNMKQLKSCSTYYENLMCRTYLSQTFI